MEYVDCNLEKSTREYSHRWKWCTFLLAFFLFQNICNCLKYVYYCYEKKVNTSSYFKVTSSIIKMTNLILINTIFWLSPSYKIFLMLLYGLWVISQDRTNTHFWIGDVDFIHHLNYVYAYKFVCIHNYQILKVSYKEI